MAVVVVVVLAALVAVVLLLLPAVLAGLAEAVLEVQAGAGLQVARALQQFVLSGALAVLAAHHHFHPQMSALNSWR